MAKKRTKSDRLERNIERLATRDEACREKFAINEQRSEPTRTTPSPESEEQIRLRAYELYEARGREDGHQLDDWLRAEEEITQRKSRAATA